MIDPEKQLRKMLEHIAKQPVNPCGINWEAMFRQIEKEQQMMRDAEGQPIAVKLIFASAIDTERTLSEPNND